MKHRVQTFIVIEDDREWDRQQPVKRQRAGDEDGQQPAEVRAVHQPASR